MNLALEHSWAPLLGLQSHRLLSFLVAVSLPVETRANWSGTSEHITQIMQLLLLDNCIAGTELVAALLVHRIYLGIVALL